MSLDTACSEWAGEAGDATISVLSWEWSMVLSVLDSVISSTDADHKIVKSVDFISRICFSGKQEFFLSKSSWLISEIFT
jgi:hypothetical protein